MYICEGLVLNLPPENKPWNVNCNFKKMNRKRNLLTILILIIFISCDKEVGIDGVVIDASTGERITGVNVKMTSEQGNREELTNLIGYFNTYKSFSCGLGNCNNDFNVEFSKDGYETKLINEKFYNSSEAEFINPEKKDTLIIKLNNN